VFICDSSGHLLIFNYVTDDRQGRVADDETFVSDSWTSKYLPVAKYLSDVQGYVAHSHGRPRNLSAVGIFSSLKFYISSSHQIPIKFKMKEKSRTAIFFHNLIGSEKKK